MSIYVLELCNNKYYVGQSHHVTHRIRQHLKGNGSVWTKFHKPTGRYRIIQKGDNPYNLLYVNERTVTYHLMLRFGYDNVRGAGWTRHDLNYLPDSPQDYKVLT